MKGKIRLKLSQLGCSWQLGFLEIPLNVPLRLPWNTFVTTFEYHWNFLEKLLNSLGFYSKNTEGENGMNTRVVLKVAKLPTDSRQTLFSFTNATFLLPLSIWYKEIIVSDDQDISRYFAKLATLCGKHSNFVERTDKQTEGQHHFLSCSSQIERQENFYLVLNIWYLVTIEILCWCKITPILLQLQLFFLLQTKDSLTLNCLQSKLV